jgi:hypothetical protein
MSTLRGVHLSIVLPSWYVFSLQKDKNHTGGMEVPLCEHLVKTICTR